MDFRSHRWNVATTMLQPMISSMLGSLLVS